MPWLLVDASRLLKLKTEPGGSLELSLRFPSQVEYKRKAQLSVIVVKVGRRSVGALYLECERVRKREEREQLPGCQISLRGWKEFATASKRVSIR